MTRDRHAASDRRGGARLLEAREVSGAELFAAYRAAIDERDGELHAYLTLARRAGGDGVPIAIKDVIATKGMRDDGRLEDARELRAGLRRDRRRALQGAAGLRMLGKTNTDEFAMGSSTENSAFGPSHNPWDPTRVPAARAVAAPPRSRAGSRRGRSAPTRAARSSSPRRSAATSACGRPTAPSRRYGVVAFASSLDQVGPVAKNVRDCALLYSIISGRDENDSTTVEVPAVELPTAEDLKGVRIGVPTEMNEADGIEPGVRDAVRKAIELGASRSAREVGECSLPRSVAYGVACYYLIAPAEASSNLARYDGVRYGLRSDGADFREMLMAHPRTTDSATSRSAASCSGPTRSRPATTTPTTARRRRCGR